MSDKTPGSSMSESNSTRLMEKTSMDSVINWKLILLPVLFVAVVFVAIKTVVHRHEARSLFIEAQRLGKERDVLAAQWSRLKLEQATALNQVSVERQARWDLGMQIPKTSDRQMIRESASYLVDADPEKTGSGKGAVGAKPSAFNQVSLGD